MINMNSKKIGAFIALNRKKKGLTQEQLGAKLGVSNKTISRWENGNYMPDLSMLEPLSKELDITLNELLTGEFVEQEKVIEYSEKNIINTLDYSTKKIQNEHKKISIFMIAIGLYLCFLALRISQPESNWGAVYSIIGLVFVIIGIFRELKISSLKRRLLICICLFFATLSTFFIIDFMGVSTSKRPPIYRCFTETTFMDNAKIIVYKNPFYHVYQINADTPNEYFVIDTKKQYTIDTVPISPFNREKSGIDNIINYQNHYIGNNSNAGALIDHLPLSEHGYVFEIDSQNYGIIISYHFTDWYDNQNLYIEKSLVYNAVSMFTLVDNLEYIDFQFSGSHYKITRQVIEENYPDYEIIKTNDIVNQDNFYQYVEQKMYDNDFIVEMFSLFEKNKT